MVHIVCPDGKKRVLVDENFPALLLNAIFFDPWLYALMFGFNKSLRLLHLYLALIEYNTVLYVHFLCVHPSSIHSRVCEPGKFD